MKQLLLLFITTFLIIFSGCYMDSDSGEDNSRTASGILEDRGDYYILGGDMALYKNDPGHQKIISALLQGKNDISTRGLKRNSARLWPNGKVYYYYNKKKFTKKERKVLDEAMDHIERACNVRFIRRTPGDYTYIIEKFKYKKITRAAVSTVGYCPEAWMRINTTTDITNVNGIHIIVHELMHCLGFSHEHQRADRDKHVIFHKENVSSDDLPYYEKINYQGSIIFDDYDFYSITHYGNNLSKIIFTAKDSRFNPYFGQGAGLSLGDRALLTNFYGSNKDCPYDKYEYLAGDFNGNGQQRVLHYINYFHKRGWVTGYYYDGNKPWTEDAGVADINMAGDFNGDGKDDLVQYAYLSEAAKCWQVRLSNGSRFGGIGIWSSRPPGDFNAVADFNGDGKDDILRYYNHKIFILYSNGKEFRDSIYADKIYCASNFLIGDFNNDGKSDVVCYVNVPVAVARIQNIKAEKGWKVFISKKKDCDYASIWTNAGDWPHTMVGDFNGDGKSDLIQYVKPDNGWRVLLSTGSSFRYSIWTDAGEQEFQAVGDFTGDGKDDVLQYKRSRNKWRVMESTGSRFRLKYWLAGDYMPEKNGNMKILVVKDYQKFGEKTYDAVVQYIDGAWWRLLNSDGYKFTHNSGGRYTAE